jgi:SNF family Na+-dependent transporter
MFCRLSFSSSSQKLADASVLGHLVTNVFFNVHMDAAFTSQMAFVRFAQKISSKKNKNKRKKEKKDSNFGSMLLP